MTIHIMKFDKKDEIILEELRKDSRATNQILSKRTKIPQTTIFNRIKKLQNQGVIEGFEVKINFSKVGKSILKSYVLVSVSYEDLKKFQKKQRDLAKEIKEISYVRKCSIVTGEADIIAELETENIQELNEIVVNNIRELKGVDRTKMVIVLEDFK